MWGLSWQVKILVSRTGGEEGLLDLEEDPVGGDGIGGFGTVPEVDAFGDDGTVLAGDGVDDAEGAGAAEVLALGPQIFGGDIAAS